METPSVRPTTQPLLSALTVPILRTKRGSAVLSSGHTVTAFTASPTSGNEGSTHTLTLSITPAVQGAPITVPIAWSGTEQTQRSYPAGSITIPVGATTGTTTITTTNDGTYSGNTTLTATAQLPSARIGGSNPSASVTVVETSASPGSQYWRLNITANNGYSGFTALNEIELYGGAVKKSTGATASASSEHASYPGALAIDSTNSYWVTGSGVTAATLTLTLTASADISSFAIKSTTRQDGSDIKDFALERGASASGPWTVVRSVTNQTGWGVNETRTFAVP